MTTMEPLGAGKNLETMHQKEADRVLKKYDAGLRHLNHYASKMPRWRYELRQRLIPIVRWETPYLAVFQEKARSPALDTYFAYTANLGTHTFYMVMLPILFWCGYTTFARALVHTLAAGVFWSGFVKDGLCLPRPLSPPLKRITMSGSVALEYGFPSTHSTNAVSVVIYALYLLNQKGGVEEGNVRTVFQVSLYVYMVSIVVGRLYCGMHGFFDVIIGSALGYVLGAMECSLGDAYINWVFAGSYVVPLTITAVVLFLVRVHPEPADDCPCFDDSVAFAGVIIGVEGGLWHFARTNFADNTLVPAATPFSLNDIGWFKAALRIVLGVAIIFVWRAAMKPTLLRYLPPLFRIIEKIGLSLPRRFFMRASQYQTVPPLRKDDNVIPPASEIPAMLSNFTHPRRRAVSVGPQSEADAYEAIAYREKQRRDSRSSPADPRSMSPSPGKEGYFGSYARRRATSAAHRRPAGAELLPSPAASRVQSYEHMMGAAQAVQTPLTPPRSDIEDNGEGQEDFSREDEAEDKEMFNKLQKPRVRYDVEVVTKLIVYAGIGWLAVEGNPVLFQLCGLGMSKR